MESCTLDTFFDGGLRVRQQRTGFRFSQDAVLLAAFVRPRRGERLLELGAGCGIVSLILAYRHADISVRGVEIQAPLAELARRNVAENGMRGRIEVVTGDMKTVSADALGGPADQVVCNPPYRKVTSGRVSPEPGRAVAQHEIRVTLVEMLAAARRLLKPRGRFTAIYPAERSAELIAEMASLAIAVKRLRWVHSRTGSQAGRMLVEGVLGGRPGVTVEAPLVIRDESGAYTREAAALFAP